MFESTIKERDRGLKRTEIIHTVLFVVHSAKGPISSCHGEPSIIHPSTIHWNHSSSALVKLANSDHLIGLHPNCAQGQICHFAAITCEL